MFSKVLVGTLISSLALGAQLAVAQPGYGNGRHAYGAPDREAFHGTRYAYARVVDVDPLVRRVRVSVPMQECWSETREEGGRVINNNANATILGGLIGAVVGNNFGRNDGRKAATVAGALIGGAIGHEAAVRRGGNSYQEPRAYEVERCATRYEDRVEEQVEGYLVTYQYQGRRYTTQTSYDPGERIRIQVDVRPAGY